jgi:hypothetical protein
MSDTPISDKIVSLVYIQVTLMPYRQSVYLHLALLQVKFVSVFGFMLACLSPMLSIFFLLSLYVSY